MKTSSCIALFLVLAAGLTGQTPRLVVPLGHLAAVKAGAFSTDGKWVLTSSWDFSTKLWDLEGREIITFTNRHEQSANAIAMSPDHRHVLALNLDGSVNLWDLNGQLLQPFSDNLSEEVCMVTAFSPDGKQVLTGSLGNQAKLWDLNGRCLQVFRGNDTSNQEWKAVSAVAFSPVEKTMLTGNFDNELVLWTLDGQRVRTIRHHVDSVPGTAISSVAFSPDGQKIISACTDNTVKMWSLDGQLLRSFPTSPIGNRRDAIQVSFSADGKTVRCINGPREGQLWDLDGNLLEQLPATLRAISPDGHLRLMPANASATVGVLQDHKGQAVQNLSGRSNALGDLYFSVDGKQLFAPDRKTPKISVWDLQERSFQTLPASSVPVATMTWDWHAELNLVDNVGMQLVKENGEVLIQKFKGPTHDISTHLLAPDGKHVLTGHRDGLARLWDLNGNVVWVFFGHIYEVMWLAFSPDGQIFATASAGNTTKIWSVASGKLLATLIGIGDDWVVLDNTGLFDASPGAMRGMHYVVGLEVIELDQLKERYYEPGLLAKALGFSKGSLREVSGFDTIGLFPAMQLQLDTPAGRLHIRLQERNGGLGKVSVFVNGKEIIEDANPPKGFNKQRDSVLTVELAPYGHFFLADTLNRIAVRAYNAEGWLKSAAQELEFWSAPGPRSKGTDAVTGLRPVAIKRNPHLYIVAVGTSDYAGDELDLNYADQDARVMAEALRQTGACLFGADSVSAYLLTTDSTRPEQHPTKTRINTVFEGIRQQAKAEDVLVVYFSGHGISYGEADRALFYYLTMDVSSDKFDDAGLRAKRTISSEELTRWINDIPAQKQVLILDACNSGRVVENLAGGRKELNATQVRALDRMKDRTGMFVLTGSAADKVSYEAGQFGQGLLTYSLLEGMKGMQLPGDRRIDVSSLFEYARDRVPELAESIRGVQTPMLLGPLGGSFDIGILGDTVRIPLAPAKPVFVRNVFLDAGRYDDHLGLSKAMDNYFRLQTLNGAKASLVYVDIPEYDNAFSVKGLYTLSGDVVTVRGRFFRGKEPADEPFEVTGSATELDVLVEAILERCAVCFK